MEPRAHSVALRTWTFNTQQTSTQAKYGPAAVLFRSILPSTVVFCSRVHGCFSRCGRHLLRVHPSLAGNLVVLRWRMGADLCPANRGPPPFCLTFLFKNQLYIAGLPDIIVMLLPIPAWSGVAKVNMVACFEKRVFFSWRVQLCRPHPDTHLPRYFSRTVRNTTAGAAGQRSTSASRAPSSPRRTTPTA